MAVNCGFYSNYIVNYIYKVTAVFPDGECDMKHVGEIQ